jgi:hypothetical protein
MPKELHIFISHKMPTDTKLAEMIGSQLALYGADQVKVKHAGRFRFGDNWRQEIQQELDWADWLIFLHTGQDADWGFCLFECGYFQARMEAASGQDKRLIILCKNADLISPALEQYKAAEATPESILALLKQIYHEPPWALAPSVGEEYLKSTAKAILDAFTGQGIQVRNFDVATGLTIEAILDAPSRRDLAQGRIPPGSEVSGTLDWQRLFGKDLNTGAWLWKDLVEQWPYRATYELLIASMVSDALLNQDSPKSTAIRSPDSSDLYRLTLRRYEQMAGDKYRFFFTLAPLDLPFEVPPEPQHQAKETIFYNLVNLSWYCRRRIVDQLYDRALQMQASLNPDPAILARLYRDIRYELTNLSAQSIMRGIDNPLALRRAMADSSGEADALLDRLQSWGLLRTEIFKAIEKGPKGLPCIVRNLYELAMQNFEFYRQVAAGYAACAEGISPPPAPAPPSPLHKPGGRARAKPAVRQAQAATKPKPSGRHTRNGVQPSGKRAKGREQTTGRDE